MRPIQVEQRYIDPYVPIFDIGWDQIRENRLIRQKHLGLVPEDTELAPRNPGVPAWNTLTKDQKKTIYPTSSCLCRFSGAYR